MKINHKNTRFLLSMFGIWLLPAATCAQPVYADINVSQTSCVSPCPSGVLNPANAVDGNPQTFAQINNALGIGGTVEIVVGFSNTGSPGSMLVVPVKKANLLLDLNLLGSVSIEALDASGNVIVQKNGLGALDAGLLSASNQTYSATLFLPKTGPDVSRVRVKLTGLLTSTSLELGDIFYIEPAGASCGIRYASTQTDGGTGICVGCSVANPDRAADTSLTNYAQITMVLGIAATRYLELGWGTPGSAGDYVGLVIGNGAGLLSLSLLGNSTITLYNGATPVDTVVASTVLGATLLAGGTERNLVGFNAPANFTSIRITMTAVAGLLNTLRIYGALTYDPTPPVMSLTVSPSSLICDGTSAQMTASAGFGSYAWSGGQTTQQITVTQAGAYMATGKNANGCPFFSPPATLSLIPKPHTPNVTADPLYCLGGNVRLILDTARVAHKYEVVHATNGAEGNVIVGTGGSLNMFANPIYASTSYRIKVTDTVTGCSTLTTVPVGVTAPGAPTTLSGNADHTKCWVKPGNRLVHFVQPGTDRIITSINPKTNDLGEVEVFSFVDGAPINIQACNTYQPWYITTVLNRRFTVHPQAQPATPVDVRLYLDQTEFGALSTAANANQNTHDDVFTLSEMVLQKYNGLNENGTFTDNCGNGTTQMVNANGNGTASAMLPGFNAGGRYIDFTVPGFSELWLSGNSMGNVSPLPVEMVQFDVTCVNGGAQLTWTTASELNNAFFGVERSADLNHWETLATVPGAGTHNGVSSYAYTDARPAAGTVYYRLIQTDLDGTQKAYDPKSVSCTDGADAAALPVLYPNPNGGEFNIRLGQAPAHMRVLMYDAAGRVWYDKEITGGKVAYGIPVVATGIPPGLYFVQCIGENLNGEPVKMLVW